MTDWDALSTLADALSTSRAVYIARQGLFFWKLKKFRYLNTEAPNTNGSELLVESFIRTIGFCPSPNEFFLPDKLKVLALSNRVLPVSEQIRISNSLSKISKVTKINEFIFFPDSFGSSELRVFYPSHTVATKLKTVKIEDIEVVLAEGAVKVLGEFISRRNKAHFFHVEDHYIKTPRQYIFSIGLSNSVGFEVCCPVEKEGVFEILDMLSCRTVMQNPGALLRGAIVESMKGLLFYATRDFTKTLKWSGKLRPVVSFHQIKEAEIELAKILGNKQFFNYLLSEKIAHDASDCEIREGSSSDSVCIERFWEVGLARAAGD